jgi:hypothetical protein
MLGLSDESLPVAVPPVDPLTQNTTEVTAAADRLKHSDCTPGSISPRQSLRGCTAATRPQHRVWRHSDATTQAAGWGRVVVRKSYNGSNYSEA